MAEMTNIEIRDFTTVQGVNDTDFVVISLSGGSSAKMAVGLFRSSVTASSTPSIKDGIWWIGSTSTGVQAEGKTPEFRKGSLGIEWKYTSEADTAWKLLVALEDIRFRFDELTDAQRDQIKLKYSDLTDEEIAELQKPANDMIAVLEQTNEDVQAAEDARVEEYAELKADCIAATEDAQDTANHPTYIGTDNYVYQWNKTAQTYDKTAVYVRGEAFSISKVYASVAAMNADTSTTFKEGDFCLINTNDVENPEDAQLYVRTAAGKWDFLVDMSGAIGFTGKVPQLFIGTVSIGSGKDSAAVTLTAAGTDADGNPKYDINYVIPSLAYEDLTSEQIAELQRPASDMIAQLQATDDSVKAAEAARVTAEDSRVAAENARATEEEAREAAEETREQNEQQRIQNEETRQSNESKRQETDAARKEDYATVRDGAVAATDDAVLAAQQARNLPKIQNGTWWLYDVETGAYVDSGYAVSSDYQLTKEKIEGVFTGDISSHTHSVYVEKEDGRQLSTEDFTTVLKEKLEGLENYDDAAITAVVNDLRSDFDTLVGGDTTTAIGSFNEVVAFLEGLEDTESLSGIIASLEQQIAAKQAEVADLDTIRSGAALGATALQEVPSEYVTEEELEAKGYATESQLTEGLAAKQDKNLYFTDLDASAWVEDSTYEDFRYRCDLSCTGVTENHYAEVVFGMEQSTSTNYAPICETGQDTVSIWADISDAITVPTVIAHN